MEVFLWGEHDFVELMKFIHVKDMPLSDAASVFFTCTAIRYSHDSVDGRTAPDASKLKPQ